MDSTILVVEDDPHLRNVITDVLSDEGYTVYQANDGQRALERLDVMEPQPDLVLSDVRMPRLTGLELAERLKQRRCPIPILLMSANYPEPHGSGLLFLSKPFALDDLITLVARILDMERRSVKESARRLSLAL